MNEKERFLAVCNGEKPDYYPIFGMAGAPGFSAGCQWPAHKRLVAGGMPEWVGGVYKDGDFRGQDTWDRYWGTTGAMHIDFFPADGFSEPLKYSSRVEGGFEIVECETGSVTRQVLDNESMYSMPEFVRYDVRDRASWEYYKKRTAVSKPWPAGRIDEACKKFDARDKPLCVHLGSTWGMIRGLMGTEAASLLLYDDPELAHDMIEVQLRRNREFMFPLIERLKPEIVATGEDNCYNHGMLISPKHFREFCSPLYKEASEAARANGAAMMAVDSDGNVMELVPLLIESGFNALFPFECKAGNDLFKLRERHPNFIMFGWLEKELVNEGNERLIEAELKTKVPPLLAKGRYFPNGDHGIQPDITFYGLCKLMTLLHEMTGNPEGEFPRVE